MQLPVLFRFLAHSLTDVRSLGLRRADSPLSKALMHDDLNLKEKAWQNM
ncbi:TPA: hypothetical protein ACPEXR_004863 [Escherichia coli]